MEPNDNINSLGTATSLNTNLENINDESILSGSNNFSIGQHIFVAMVTLGIILLLVTHLSQKKKDKEEQNAKNQESLKKIALEQGLIEKSEELKNRAWKKWFMKLQVDWKIFNSDLENDKQKWLDEKSLKWKEWLNFMESKWTHHNENMDTKFKSYVLKNSQNWDENKWESWMKNDGKTFMEMDYNKWMRESRCHYVTWVVKQWEQWKNEKICTWLLKDWRRNEFEYWQKFKDLTLPEPLSERAKNNWNKWNLRVSKEKEQWIRWVSTKYNLYENSECQIWRKWKDERKTLFNEWMESFMNSWIAGKKWNLWNEQKQNAFS
ncbi:tryptophan-rich antigen [Plasmodium gonderi]|uniref:Tryptophan-rich antigen n=1 Tax=Plasmodium gonderi TaxID=77519 RepID=A0A1Y1JRR3_PLAGO|nr:tryptophan-rich antigen [Plasmodium gonderi]GAW83887.1 tryptophan-rich antigen [Plasmodium gonderi]